MNDQMAESYSTTPMRLRVLEPTAVLVDQPVLKIAAEADNGEFCLLPKHIDFVTSLAPSVLCFWTNNNQQRYVAIDHSILVKCDQEVTVSARNAIPSSALEDIHQTVAKHFLDIDEHERNARTALARLETATLRGFRELQEGLHG